MSRVITFSLDFPKKHPRCDQSTFFVEGILNSLGIDYGNTDYWGMLQELNPWLPKKDLRDFWSNLVDTHVGKKHHSIRAGSRWKVGDKFTPRVWGDDKNPKSGKRGPYQSKQITFAPDIEVKKIWRFDVDGLGVPFLDTVYLFDSYNNENWPIDEVAKNDGLDTSGLIEWFKCHPKKKGKVFYGQIVCWNETITYD